MPAGEEVRLQGVDGWDAWDSQKDAAQGGEGVDAVLPGRFDLSADTAEVHEGVIPDCSQRVAQAFQPVQAQAKACGYRK